MNFNDDDNDELERQEEGYEDEQETGSDELLSADDLRLPEGASVLVRLHALRAWLTRRERESSIAVGEAALVIQQLLQADTPMRPTRRSHQDTSSAQLVEVQHTLTRAQQQLAAYEEAQELLTECIDHTTPGQRTLVEYYLMLDERIQQSNDEPSTSSEARLHALQEVLQHVEHVGIPDEEE